MLRNLASEPLCTLSGALAFQLMAPAVEKAIRFLVIASLPVGSCLGWLTGELIRKGFVRKKQRMISHLLNALTGIIGFLFGAYVSFRSGSPRYVLPVAILSSVILVLILRFCIHILAESPKLRK
jgi:hypothetical protein